jgi:hypothetical protein
VDTDESSETPTHGETRPAQDQLAAPRPATRAALQESAFWSSQLFREAARSRLVGLCVIAAIIVILALLVASIDTGDAGAVAARAATVALATLITADEGSGILASFAAARVAGDVVRQLDADQTMDTGRLLAVFADYSVAGALSTPIPTRVYEKRHDRIETAWRSRGGQGA